MTRTQYHEYLASREWAQIKKTVTERSGGLCERCKARPAASVHHKTYEHLGAERLEDILHLCEPCHLFLSAKSDSDPTEYATTYGDSLQLIAHSGPEYCRFCFSDSSASGADFQFAIGSSHRGDRTQYICEGCLEELIVFLSDWNALRDRSIMAVES